MFEFDVGGSFWEYKSSIRVVKIRVMGSESLGKHQQYGCKYW